MLHGGLAAPVDFQPVQCLQDLQGVEGMNRQQASFAHAASSSSRAVITASTSTIVMVRTLVQNH